MLLQRSEPSAQLRSAPMELPGIEPSLELTLSWDDSGFEYAKRRENTRNDLRIRGRC